MIRPYTTAKSTIAIWTHDGASVFISVIRLSTREMASHFTIVAIGGELTSLANVN